MILIDSNAMVILLIGMIDARLFKTHKRTSIYDEQDFDDLVMVIGSLTNLIVLPNVWTEVDNLLNNFSGNYKDKYVSQITATLRNTTEKFVASINATRSPSFYNLGLTDSLLLDEARNCRLLITSDSSLSDYAVALSIPVYDMVKNRNNRI